MGTYTVMFENVFNQTDLKSPSLKKKKKENNQEKKKRENRGESE